MSIHFKRIFMIIFNDGKDFVRSLFGMFDFKEWMTMAWSSLTILAQVKISANWTFVSDSFNAIFSAFITSNSFMNNFLVLWANRRLFKKRFFDFFHELRHQLFEFFFNICLSDSANLAWLNLRLIKGKMDLFFLWFFLFNDFRLIIFLLKRFITFRNWLDVFLNLDFRLILTFLKQRLTWLNRIRFLLRFQS